MLRVSTLVTRFGEAETDAVAIYLSHLGDRGTHCLVDGQIAILLPDFHIVFEKETNL